MTPYAGVSDRSLCGHPLNNGLLFQFILDDFLAAMNIIKILDDLCHDKPLPTEEKTYLIHNKHVLLQLEQLLAQLIGTRHDYVKRFSCSFQEGAVAKLKTYCSIFFQQADSEEKELIAMHHYADKTWQHCLIAQEALRDAPERYAKLVTHLEKASQALHRFSKLITRVIPQFRDDENVVFYVLRHHLQFDAIYGRRFVTKLFCRIYPKGVKETELFLTKRYLERHFDNLPIAITGLFADLEAASL